MSENHKTGIEMARAALAAAREAARTKKVIKRTRKERPVRSAGDPRKFGSAISDLINDRGWQEEMAVGSIIGRWDEVVGSEIASHVQPTSFQDGVLYLAADSTAWATQVRLMAPDLLRSLSQAAGHGLISKIEVQGPAAPSWRKGPRSAKGRGPRDTYG